MLEYNHYEATYSVNNLLFARKDMVLGWCVRSLAAEAVFQWVPISAMDEVLGYSSSDIVAVGKFFDRPGFPIELKEEFAKVAKELEKKQKAEETKKIEQTANELAELKVAMKRVLNDSLRRFVTFQFPMRTDGERLRTIKAYASDFVFDLVPARPSAGKFASIIDCPVMITNNNPPELLELTQGIVPRVE